MGYEITEKMINAYIDKVEITRGETPEELEYIKKCAKQNLLNDIKREIIILEEDRIKKEVAVECTKMKEDAQNEIKRQEQERKIKEIKILMYEGFFIAFVVGLIVNQTTDLLNITKGKVDTNVGLTLGWMSVLGIAALLMYNFKFLIDITNWIKKRFKNKKE